MPPSKLVAEKKRTRTVQEGGRGARNVLIVVAKPAKNCQVWWHLSWSMSKPVTAQLLSATFCLRPLGRGLSSFSSDQFYFILERCLLLAHKRLSIQTTNAIKDVANEGHISPEIFGDPCTKTWKMRSLFRVIMMINDNNLVWYLVTPHRRHLIVHCQPIDWSHIAHSFSCFLSLLFLLLNHSSSRRPKTQSSPAMILYPMPVRSDGLLSLLFAGGRSGSPGGVGSIGAVSVSSLSFRESKEVAWLALAIISWWIWL